MGIAGESIPGELRIDRRAPALCVLQLFQAEDARRLAQHETVPVLVEGPRGCFGRVVALRQGHDVPECGEPHRIDDRFRPPREYRVGHSHPDHGGGNPEGMVSGSTGRVH